VAKEHTWIKVYVEETNVSPIDSQVEDGAVYSPMVAWCGHCGLVRDGLYADLEDAYYVYGIGRAVGADEEYERWAYAQQPECVEREEVPAARKDLG
jgi:hypothetical protein